MKPVNLMLAGAAALFLAAATHSIASAQTSAPPPPAAHFKNLKVFPADIPRPQLIAAMKGFAQGLGVRCTFCHVGAEGQPPSTYDFASDAKPEKLVARAMLRMVGDLNGRVLPAIPGLKDAKVTCFTCHRGDKKPLIAPPPAPPVPPPPPPPPGA